MMHRIRGAMQDDGKLLTGLVEMDICDLDGVLHLAVKP